MTKKPDTKSRQRLRDGLANASELAEVSGISGLTVGKVMKDASVQRLTSGKFNVGSALLALFAYERARSRGAEDQDDSKSRLLATKAHLEELKLARELRQTITVRWASEQYEAILAGFRSQLLALPKKLAPTITDGMTAGEREAIITRAIHGAMRELAALPGKLREGSPEVEEDPEGSSDDA